jgi:hypothetical protein
MFFQRTKRHHEQGSILLLTLVFAGVFTIIVSSLAGFLLVQQKVERAKADREQAFQIAEAGLDYYKWFLAHFPTDLEDGTGESGPYVHDFTDPEGGTIGQFSLQVSGNAECGTLSSVDITSTGTVTGSPSLARVIFGRYSRPSVAEFSYILNSSVWAGSDRQIYGPYHSNGGIRMDGTNYSNVTSAVSAWQCTSSFGCNTTKTEPGVFGAGSGSSFWKYPVAPVDFNGISVDLVNMKNLAETEGGLYYPPAGKGYHVILNSNGTMTVYRVNNTSSVWSYSDENGWVQDPQIITSQTSLGTVAIPSGCSLAFFEDDVWLEGTVSGKVTVVAANVTTPNVSPRIILSGNITYATDSTVDGLTAIAEDSVLIPLISPTDMELHGIFIAQNGRFSRDHYETSGSYKVPNADKAYVTQNDLAMYGTIVSNGRVGTQWTCGGVYCSGYATRENYYDKNLADSPPPLTPFTSEDYRFIDWREDD